MSGPLQINLEEDRFSRFRLIGWWDQEKLRAAKVLVIGAGALGNEIIKNLALVGVGNLLICDKDRIEHSNLSRSILYRAKDAGQSKAEVAASAATTIYPEMNVASFHGDIVHDLGLGVFRWADLVMGGLDNRLARLAINRNCYRVGRPWIDGAIEQIQGVARVFVPDGACYECTMSRRDWQILQARRSCNLLSRSEMEGGKTPTTPTISSIIAGIQVQEAVKLIHGLQTIAGRGWVFDGLSTEAFQSEYQRKPDCLSHDPIDQFIEIPKRSDDITFEELAEFCRPFTGAESLTFELTRDILEKFVCPHCRREETVLRSLGKVRSAQAMCPDCAGVEREVVTFNRIAPQSPHLGRTPAQIGVPPFDVLIVRTNNQTLGLEFSADAKSVLGELAHQDLELL